MPDAPYNPLDKWNLGRSVADALLECLVRDLADTDGLVGAGVYAIYYAGSYEPYGPLAARNRDGRWAAPIYVGKAIPRGGRKGGLRAQEAVGRALQERLKQHAQSIRQASNLDLSDFAYRCLAVDDIWIPLGENMLIELYRPLWNLVVDGFGNKDPGIRRATQYRSPWDVLHPGRRFVDKLAAHPDSADRHLAKVADYFATGAVVIEPEDVPAD